ncbi:2-oxoglutarate dehydrogenase complex dihydrolipoyllysine-residue succinyltransferase [Desmospora profundinema]|uniref:Dihydrolipoyllysine-residue succinyltransferase component of 2-oxoglutarate dehydrogenase complex n=1 Tax=Desmospora profundinema TaxID=1571184 RepID=A0ABU1IJ85_9BACL|nr:2-oxoglutarate dehydrogenase complex dihydrolipoyllysine-residue succinyltransferase [Desmospora profundinema]MDR6224839.1 2-oxoglutarate dehydrogenase E2 component (dihydrolipoamide succinyltransferase) [Desmospora profundinema]
MIEVKVPELAESITEGTIANWVKSEGDSVEEGDVLLELDTDKVSLEIQAEHAGVLRKIKKQEGDTVEVGEVIALLAEGAEAGADGASGEKAEEASPVGEAVDAIDPRGEETGETDNGDSSWATPAARKRARERGIDLSKVSGRDPMGRITTEDVDAHGKQPETKPAPAPSDERKLPQQAKAGDSKRPADDPAKPVERVRMTRRRQTIANRLVQAQQNAAMLTTFNEVDMTAVMEVRRRRKESFREQHDVNLGFMSFFTKAVIGALKAYPLVNAEIQGEELLIKKYYDIGIAVSTDDGLVVPVVRDADRKSFAGIEKEIASLAKKARENALSLNDLTGGTFTITNGGIFGSLLSTPILNAPQVGILGMHKIQQRPVTLPDGTIESRPMMYIALSYDHRIIDGKEAVGFLVRIKEMLEDPEVLLLEG